MRLIYLPIGDVISSDMVCDQHRSHHLETGIRTSNM